MTLLPVIAHAGPGHTWQAMLVVAGVALMGVLVAAAIGKLPMTTPDHLILPLAIIAIGASLAPMASSWLSDVIGAGIPLAAVALVTLLLAVFTPLDIRLPAPLPMGALALAVVATILLFRPLNAALHPPADVLPLADDSAITIVEPSDGAVVDAGSLVVEVTVTGGSIGPGGVPLEQLPDDPEEAGSLAVAIQPLDADGAVAATQQRLDVDYDQMCTVEDPCGTVTFSVEVDPGDHLLTIDFTRGDDVPFATTIRDQATFTAR